jgi:nucleotide-binding universal stress UspA family protein
VECGSLVSAVTAADSARGGRRRPYVEHNNHAGSEVTNMPEQETARRVMCAVDDSASGLPVVTVARRLADGLDAELIVVHAVSVPEEEVQAVPMAIRAWLHDTDPRILLLEGNAGGAILEAAEEQEATLLVVGARGRSPLRAAVLGSVSREVAAGATCPVVVVPAAAAESAAPTGQNTDGVVICGVDNSDLSIAAAGFSGRLAQRLGSRVVVVHARQNLRSILEYRHPSSATPPVTGQDDAVARQVEETTERAAKAAGGEALEVVEPGPPVTVLKEVADRYNAEFIVVAAAGRGAISSALLGSVAAELPATAERPVIVVPREVAERWIAGEEWA